MLPNNFIWGAAAASYQIEGGAYDDGKGLSVWDMMCRIPDKVFEGETGEIACDHYHRWQEDVNLMAEVGIQAYRLSISWPRVIPDGTGKVNAAGLAFYDRLVDALLEKNIQPWITLFHWDYPYELFCRGGWLNPNSSDWFADYAKVIIEKLSDRVSHWMTQNEPQCYLGLGHQAGVHAPGICLGFAEVLRAIHNSHLGHGKAVMAMRAAARQPLKIGAAPVGVVKIPATNTNADIEAARKDTFGVFGLDCWNNSWFADPLILGNYPQDGLELFREYLPKIADDDLKTMCQPLDFYGVNIYQGQKVKAEPNGLRASIDIPGPLGRERTMMDWPVTPEALYWGPKFLYERYKLPVVVTENGLACCDWVHHDGAVHDPQRIDFLTKYIREFKRAATDGVPCQGYFQWSIMDNFEWAEGYRKRFGLIHVDYQTQKRTLKDSAYWYKNVISTNGKEI